MNYDSKPDTIKHIERVRELLFEAMQDLKKRSEIHDSSKLLDPEKVLFDKWTPELKRLEYGSDEYKAALDKMGPALQHHYENNSHHPEHYDRGVYDMSLFDLIEMLADWKAASERHANGDYLKSLFINEKRFDIDNTLLRILICTVKELGWED